MVVNAKNWDNAGRYVSWILGTSDLSRIPAILFDEAPWDIEKKCKNYGTEQMKWWLDSNHIKYRECKVDREHSIHDDGFTPWDDNYFCDYIYFDEEKIHYLVGKIEDIIKGEQVKEESSSEIVW